MAHTSAWELCFATVHWPLRAVVFTSGVGALLRESSVALARHQFVRDLRRNRQSFSRGRGEHFCHLEETLRFEFTVIPAALCKSWHTCSFLFPRAGSCRVPCKWLRVATEFNDGQYFTRLVLRPSPRVIDVTRVGRRGLTFVAHGHHPKVAGKDVVNCHGQSVCSSESASRLVLCEICGGHTSCRRWALVGRCILRSQTANFALPLATKPETHVRELDHRQVREAARDGVRRVTCRLSCCRCEAKWAGYHECTGEAFLRRRTAGHGRNQEVPGSKLALHGKDATVRERGQVTPHRTCSRRTARRIFADKHYIVVSAHYATKETTPHSNKATGSYSWYWLCWT